MAIGLCRLAREAFAAHAPAVMPLAFLAQQDEDAQTKVLSSVLSDCPGSGQLCRQALGVFAEHQVAACTSELMLLFDRDRAATLSAPRSLHGSANEKVYIRDACLQGLWAGVWAEGAPSTSAALRLYMDDIVPLIHQGTQDPCSSSPLCRLTSEALLCCPACWTASAACALLELVISAHPVLRGYACLLCIGSRLNGLVPCEAAELRLAAQGGGSCLAERKM